MPLERRRDRRPTPFERWIASHPFKGLVLMVGAPVVAFLVASSLLPGFYSWGDFTTVIGMFGLIALTGIAVSRRLVVLWPTPG